MDMQRSKMTHDSLLLFEANTSKVLVTKNQGAALSCIQSQLIKALGIELGKLDAVDLSADMGREIEDLCGIFEEG